MSSRRWTEARPVRMCENFRRASSTVAFMCFSASAFTCMASILSLLLWVVWGTLDARSDALAHDHSDNVASLPHVEDDDRKAVVAAERDGRHVHHAEVTREHLVV